MTAPVVPAAPPARVSLREIAWRFLVIGATGFGGGMAVVALVQEECVRRRRWLPADEFAHGVAFSQILGPFTVNAVTFVGYRLRGLAGAATAAAAFLAPSVALVIALSALYFRYHCLPAMHSALNGVGPVVAALVISAAWQTGGSRAREARAVAIAAGAAALLLLLHWPLAAIMGLAALVGLLSPRGDR